MSASSVTRELRRKLQRDGFMTSVTPGGHLRIEHDGMRGPVFAARTPSDHRAVRNTLAMLRRKMRDTAILERRAR
jgi:hypothetical protein